MSDTLAASSGTASELPVAMSPTETWRLLLGLGLATWMEFYTFDAVNLVLPDMAGTFGVSLDQAQARLNLRSTSLLISRRRSSRTCIRVGPRLCASMLIPTCNFVGTSTTSNAAPGRTSLSNRRKMPPETS